MNVAAARARPLLFLLPLVLLANASNLTAQFLYSVSSDPGIPLVRVDPATGNVVVLQPTGAEGVTGGTSTIDAVGRRLFFIGPLAGVQTLFVVDLTTGTTTARPLGAVGATLGFLEFDSTTGFLYSVVLEPGLPFARIDPATGNVQVFAPTGADALTLGTSAIDTTGHRLFFVGPLSGVQTLFVVDLTTGITTTHPLLSSASSVIFLEFDPVTGSLYSVSSEVGAPLVRIDPATGAVVVFPSTGAEAITAGTSAIDPTGRRLFFLGPLAGLQTLFVVDLRTGRTSPRPLASIGRELLFLVFLPGFVADVPMTDVLGSILLVLGLGLAGYLFTRAP